ncbi:MAG: tRNA (N6-threonylcarbamoyladenosine(37)-N6)-methyltransferase TrmO [Candidatus Kapabacteria bacterium]|nr:tRNA (N6-threonylcarbamoyladenosine(37)-N6)-methyltransferase TrmO [Candidatus Kapabacteria bacterium]
MGYVRTSHASPYDAPRQPNWDNHHVEAVIELNPHENFEQAVRDLEGCERIWLVTVFDRVENWKPLVLPPRGRTKRGVFATRSPHRPNPIGLTCVRLLRVEGRCLFVEDTDLLDGTPVLDIKPYLAYADAFPESRLPWVDESNAPLYRVEWCCPVGSIPDDERRYVERVLSADPLPHPYRRIKKADEGHYLLSLRHARFRYRINDDTVSIVDYTVDLPE